MKRNRTTWRKITIFLSIIFSPLILYPVPNYFDREIYPFTFAYMTNKPVSVDGVLDEKCWEKASTANCFLELYDNRKTSTVQTSFKVVCDGKKIYFGIQAEEPDISKLILEKADYDNWPPGDSIEIFLDTRLTRSSYYQLAANLAGSRFDGYMFDKTWNNDWQTASKIAKNGWSMEIGIDLAGFIDTPIPQKGTCWGLNVCRNSRGIISKSTTWAAVGPGFHNPKGFNILIFGTPADYWKTQITNCREENCKFHLYLRGFNLKEINLEKKLSEIDRIIQELSSEKRKFTSGRKKDFLPLYHKIESIRTSQQEIAAEMEVISALQTIKDLY